MFEISKCRLEGIPVLGDLYAGVSEHTKDATSEYEHKDRSARNASHAAVSKHFFGRIAGFYFRLRIGAKPGHSTRAYVGVNLEVIVTAGATS